MVKFDGYTIKEKQYSKMLFLYPGKVCYYDSVWNCDSCDIEKTGFFDQVNVLKNWKEIKVNLQDVISKAIDSARNDDYILNHFEV